MQGDGTGTTTLGDNTAEDSPLSPPSEPGLVVIFEKGRPACRVLRLSGGSLDLGRQLFEPIESRSSRISRRHARVVVSGEALAVFDLGSRNGSFVNGARVESNAKVPAGSTLRLGDVVLLSVRDFRRFSENSVRQEDGMIVGPSLRRALQTITMTQRHQLLNSVFVRGETGTGKELAAQAFHRAGRPSHAPLVAVNCATISKELAERLLFGSRKGVYSGATDSLGQVQAAHGGTLFLDEVAELSPEVQGKLLRVLETREVLRLGATRPEPVDVRVCAATWRDLRAEVSAGRFREDLYFRIGQPEVRLPPLRDRLEELPWHVQAVLDESIGSGPSGVTAELIEAYARRPWPGNVRELRAEVRRAAATTNLDNASRLGLDDLSEHAGKPFGGVNPAQPSFPEDDISLALREMNGNVSSAARRLGVHRNRIRRWLDRHDVGADTFKKAGV